MQKDGKVDVELRKNLDGALKQIKDRVNELDSLLKKISLSGTEKKKLSKYLEAINNYHPFVYKQTFDTTRINIINQDGNSIIFQLLYRSFFNFNQILYGDILNKDANEILVHYSVGRDRSPRELAKAFIADFNRQEKNNRANLPRRSIKARFTVYDRYLMETASTMDEMLTLNMKKVFAPLFINYFDRYAESFLENELISSIGLPPKSRII